MADETEILKVTIDTSDGDRNLDAFVAKAESAAKRISAAFAGIKPPSHLEHDVDNLGKKFEELAERVGSAFKQMGSRFGEGGSLIAELAEKIAAAIGKIPSSLSNAGAAIGKFGETSKAAGGGMSGFAAAAASVGEALGPIALASVAAGAGVTTLIYAAAASASKLSDLRQALEGTEADFARVEIAGRQTSLGTEAMAGAAVRIREGFRAASVELQNYGEMLQLMQDREATAAERTKLLAEKRNIRKWKEYGADVSADELKLQKEQEKLSEKVAATMEERQKSRLERMRRNLQENMSGIARIFAGPDLLQSLDPSKIEQLGKSLEKIRGGVANVDELKNELKSLAEIIIETGTKGPEAMLNLDRGLNQVIGPEATRKLKEYVREWQRTANTTNEAAETVNVAMGGLSEEARQNLDHIHQDFQRMIHDFEEMATRVGSFLSPLIGLFDTLYQAINKVVSAGPGLGAAFRSAFEAVPGLAPLVKVLGAVADAYERAAKAANEHAEAEKKNSPQGYPSYQDYVAAQIRKLDESTQRAGGGKTEERPAAQAGGERPAQRDEYGEQVKAAIEKLPEMISRPILDIASRMATGHGYEGRPATAETAPKVEEVGAASENSAPKVEKLGDSAEKTASTFDKAVDIIINAISKLGSGGGSSSSSSSSSGKAAEHAAGGYISGPGTATSDSILARLSDGEFVMSAKAVNHYGAGFMQKLNARMYAEGGLISAAPEQAIPVLGLWDEDIEYTKLGYHRSRRTGHWLKANDEELTRDEIAQIDRQLRIKFEEETARILERDLEERQRAQDEAAMRKHEARQHADGGLIEAFKGFAGGGLADSFADAFSLSLPKFASGGTVSAGPAAALHPLYLSFNNGGYVGGLTATPSAVDQISRHAVLAQAASTMASKPSWLR